MYRFKHLAAFMFIQCDAIALAIDRWMEELELWLSIAFAREIDRESRNHNPWGEGGQHCDPVAFEQ